MHILSMILEHVVCKVVDYALHQLWMVLQKAFDVAVTALFLCLFAPLLKELDRIQRGFAVLFLLVAIGAVSAASLRVASED